MTSLSFILGVAPLAVATGAGAEMRQSLGTAVLFGMLGVTCFGLLFTPAFYTFIRNLGRKGTRRRCRFRKSYPRIAMVQSRKNWRVDDHSAPLDSFCSGASFS
jgi:hypothetical protein